MKPFLLDTNVLLALAWPNHVHHPEAQDWFEKHAAGGFRTCPMTQAAFVRISSNPAFISNAVTPHEALRLLLQIIRMPGHQFWPDDVSLADAGLCERPLMGHRQVNDAYLLALAKAHGGVLATLDRGPAELARNDKGLVALVGQRQLAN